MIHFRTAHVIIIVMIGSTGCQLFQTTDSDVTSWQLPAVQPTESVSSQNTADVQIGLGRMYEKQNSKQAAMNAYLAALKHVPDHPEAYWRLGVLQDQLGNFPSAEQNFQQSLSLNPLNPECLCDYGYSLYLQGRWKTAEEKLRKTLSIDASHRRAHNILGIMQARNNHFDVANQHFQQAGCTFTECEENLAFAMILDNRLEEARDHYERALLLEPTSKKSQKNLQLLAPMIADRSSVDQPGVLPR